MRRGREIKREPSGVGDLIAAADAGAQAGFLQIADTFTFGQIEAVSQANAAAWDEIGLAGTWTQTISGGAALVAREALITAATLGTGAAIQGARAAAQGTRAATTAARLGGTASKTARFFNSARSPLAQGVGSFASGSTAALRTTQAVNAGLVGYEAVTTVRDAYDGYQMLRAGNPWGWLSIAGAGLSGLTAGIGGYGTLRRFGGVGENAPSPGAVTRNSNLTRKLRLPKTNQKLTGTDTLGETSVNGQVFLQPGLSRQQQIFTLRHESVHAFLSVPDDAPLAFLRQAALSVGYKYSQLLRFTEEAVAEGYAHRSIIKGLRHPFITDENGARLYDITVRGLAVEGLVYGTVVIGGGYLANQIGGELFDDE